MNSHFPFFFFLSLFRYLTYVYVYRTISKAAFHKLELYYIQLLYSFQGVKMGEDQHCIGR